MINRDYKKVTNAHELFTNSVASIHGQFMIIHDYKKVTNAHELFTNSVAYNVAV